MSNFLEKLKYRFQGKKISAVKFADNGGTIEFLENLRQYPGIIRDSWNGTGYELGPDITPIRIIHNNRERMGFAISEKGVGVKIKDRVILKKRSEETDFETRDRAVPGSETVDLIFEGVIGKLTAVNVLEKGIDLEPNDRALWIRLGIGIVIGLILSPMLQSVI